MLVTIDLETERIQDRETILSKGNKPTNVSPYVTPRPVLASVAFDNTEGKEHTLVADMDEFYKMFVEFARGGHTLAGHNIADFDLDVLYTHGPYDVKEAVMTLLDRGVVDTMLLDWLVRLADGVFDMPQYNPHTRAWNVPHSGRRSLAKLVKDFFNVEMDKDPSVRCGFGQFLGKPLSAIPEQFLVYARQDAILTHRAVKKLLELAPEGDEFFGPLSCYLQARAAFVAKQMDKQGVHVDAASAGRIRELFEADLPELEGALIDQGLAEWRPVPKAPREVSRLPVDAEVHDWRPV